MKRRNLLQLLGLAPAVAVKPAVEDEPQEKQVISPVFSEQKLDRFDG